MLSNRLSLLMHMIFATAVWAIFMPGLSWSAGPKVFDDPKLEDAKRALEVQWFKPEVIDTKKDSKVIFFTGKTKPRARVHLRSERIVKIEPDGSHRGQDL